MTFADSVPMMCWQSIEHADGHTWVVVAVGRKRGDVMLAVRRRLYSLSRLHVQEQATIVRVDLVKVLREIADNVEGGVVES